MNLGLVRLNFVQTICSTSTEGPIVIVLLGVVVTTQITSVVPTVECFLYSDIRASWTSCLQKS